MVKLKRVGWGGGVNWSSVRMFHPYFVTEKPPVCMSSFIQHGGDTQLKYFLESWNFLLNVVVFISYIIGKALPFCCRGLTGWFYGLFWESDEKVYLWRKSEIFSVMKGTGMVTTGCNYSPVCGPNPLSWLIRVKISKLYNVRFLVLSCQYCHKILHFSHRNLKKCVVIKTGFLKVVSAPVIGSIMHKPAYISQSFRYIIWDETCHSLFSGWAGVVTDKIFVCFAFIDTSEIYTSCFRLSF